MSYAESVAAERNAMIEEMLKIGSTEEDINKIKAAFEEHDAALAREAYAKSKFKQKLLEKYRAWVRLIEKALPMRNSGCCGICGYRLCSGRLPLF